MRSCHSVLQLQKTLLFDDLRMLRYDVSMCIQGPFITEVYGRQILDAFPNLTLLEVRISVKMLFSEYMWQYLSKIMSNNGPPLVCHISDPKYRAFQSTCRLVPDSRRPLLTHPHMFCLFFTNSSWLLQSSDNGWSLYSFSSGSAKSKFHSSGSSTQSSESLDIGFCGSCHDTNGLLGTHRLQNRVYHAQTNRMFKQPHHTLNMSLMVQPDPHNWARDLLGVLLSIKEDLSWNTAQLTFGTTSRLPGYFGCCERQCVHTSNH